MSIMSDKKIENILTEKTIEAIKSLYEQSISPNQVTLQKTKVEFEGDITLLVFPLTKVSKKSPEETAHAIGTYLKENVSEVTAYNVVKGFLNLVIADYYWTNYLINSEAISDKPEANVETVMVEFSSPNTNKPLHLGHIRNNLLGASVSDILKAAGKKVIRVNLVNDRGIHICKSMLAWKKWGNGGTSESSGVKGDHLVGKYYVKFEQENIKAALDYLKHIISKNQYIDTRTSKIPQSLLDTLIIRIIDSNILEKQNISFKEIMSNKSIIYNEVEQNLITEFLKDNNFLMFDIREMLLKWEAGDKETRELWEMMNSWVYKGFEATYKMLGVDFDKTYYESNTYLSGKNIVEEGLKNGVLKRRADNSVYIDLTADGLDEKTLLRA